MNKLYKNDIYCQFAIEGDIFKDNVRFERTRILGILVEGNSLRATSRLADVSINTLQSYFSIWVQPAPTVPHSVPPLHQEPSHLVAVGQGSKLAMPSRDQHDSEP
jgi:hypothetical protein